MYAWGVFYRERGKAKDAGMNWSRLFAAETTRTGRLSAWPTVKLMYDNTDPHDPGFQAKCGEIVARLVRDGAALVEAKRRAIDPHNIFQAQPPEAAE